MTWREIKELYDITTPDLVPGYSERSNIAPTQQSLIVRQHENGEREAVMARWGLVPLWSKSIDKILATFNAMSETVETKPTFRAAWKSRPCLVVASGFYEWAGNTPKQPYFVTRKDARPFAFGGLWGNLEANGWPCNHFVHNPDRPPERLHRQRASQDAGYAGP